MQKNSITNLVIICLGLVFLLAAFSKIGDLGSFSNVVEKMVYLPTFFKGLLILLLPGLELTLGLCLLTRFALNESVYLAAGLLAIFLLDSIYMNATNHHVDCGCFKSAVPLLKLEGWWIAVRNLGLFVMSMFCVWSLRTNQAK